MQEIFFFKLKTMFLLWPIHWYHSQGDFIWPVGPFNMFIEQCVNMCHERFAVTKTFHRKENMRGDHFPFGVDFFKFYNYASSLLHPTPLFLFIDRRLPRREETL
jgi:hypothetical protein